MTKQFLIVDSGNLGVHVWVAADNERAAHKAAWAGLTNDQRDACEGLECVDEKDA